MQLPRSMKKTWSNLNTDPAEMPAPMTSSPSAPDATAPAAPTAAAPAEPSAAAPAQPTAAAPAEPTAATPAQPTAAAPAEPTAAAALAEPTAATPAETTSPALAEPTAAAQAQPTAAAPEAAAAERLPSAAEVEAQNRWAELENAFVLLQAERDALKQEVKSLRQQCVDENMKDSAERPQPWAWGGVHRRSNETFT
eukprot:s3314_g4.t1